MERPFIYAEDGTLKTLCIVVKRGSYTVFVPIKEYSYINYAINVMSLRIHFIIILFCQVQLGISQNDIEDFSFRRKFKAMDLYSINL
jgi:hypothetical protein